VFQRIPKLQQHDQAVWWDTLGKMQKLLRKAALSLATSGQMDRDTMHNYFMSGERHSPLHCDVPGSIASGCKERLLLLQ
jgi:hypothetical protein